MAIYYEGGLARLALDEQEKPQIDPAFEEATEGEKIDRREKLKTKRAQLEAIVGGEKRLALVAREVIEHFGNRLEVMVVCVRRHICIDLYHKLVRLRPDWHDDGDAGGALNVEMTGAASVPNDPLRVVLVRDMWLTGFDVPSLHTMYCGQADAGPRPDAGHRTGQPRVPGSK